MLGAIFETIPDFNHCDLFKKRFVIFLKGATLSDFFYTRLSNYVSSGIQIHFPLFRRIFFQLGSNLIKSGLINVIPFSISRHG